jgi:type IV pilus assembly protein PilA
MKTLSTRKGGFTLIELMIVVAIIGILAAIAIPNFLRFQLRAKSSEGKTNLAAIRTAEEGYFAEFGTYVIAALTPPAASGTAKQVWPGEVGFDQMGWSPEGDVFFQYQVNAGDTTGGTANNEFYAWATANIDGGDSDGDGITNQEWAYVKPAAGAANTTAAAALGVCNAAGVYNPISATFDLLETVGPCDSVSGQAEF